MVFPVSSVMLDRIDEYQSTLQSHSGALMPYIDWRPTIARNVEVLNDTADLYRYYDVTAAAEFLYACVRRSKPCWHRRPGLLRARRATSAIRSGARSCRASHLSTRTRVHRHRLPTPPDPESYIPYWLHAK
jgi:hypothetical protein